MMKKTRQVIFLDIDGVLQPHGKQDRFDHDLDRYVTGTLAQNPGKYRCDEVTEYLKNNPIIAGDG
jgi:hypothetical protein